MVEMEEQPTAATEFRKVPIRPFECLSRSTALMGDSYWLFVGITAAGMLIAWAVPLGILLGPMFCGMYLCYRKRERAEELRFKNLFDGFDWFKESLIVALIQTACYVVIFVPGYVLMVVGLVAVEEGGRGGDAEGWAIAGIMLGTYGLMILWAMLVGMLFIFTYPLIMDRGLTAFPAIKTSIAAVFGNLFGLVGLTLLCTVILVASALCCYLPFFFVWPVCLGANWIAYRKVFPAPPTAADVALEAEFTG